MFFVPSDSYNDYDTVRVSTEIKESIMPKNIIKKLPEKIQKKKTTMYVVQDLPMLFLLG